MRQLGDENKREWSGNLIRDALKRAGFPEPNKTLIDRLAPIVMTTKDGSTSRRWHYSSAEIAPILAEIRPSLHEIEGLLFGDSGMINERIKAVTKLFYERLDELDRQKANASSKGR